MLESTKESFVDDPNDLILINRTDFTNYHVFYNYYKKNDLILEKIIEFNPELNIFIVENNNSKPIFRFLYRLIYYISDIQNSEEENNKKIKEEDNEIILINKPSNEILNL